jgi:3-hydroxymyristoyl/3-hydroxydecanoyl-(acyl carrier protein) dehydratase
MSNEPLYDISVIEDILPHRSPFLFVDRVMIFDAGKNIITEKDLAIDDCYFSGHFPGNPVMPGIIVSEALAQTCGLLMGLTWREKDRLVDHEKMNLFLANVHMKFASPAKPGDTLRLQASLKKEYGGLFLFDVAAHVLSGLIAKGTLSLAEKDI